MNNSINPNIQDLQLYLDIATEAVCSAGAILKSYWGKIKESDRNEKRPGDLVTIADKEAEAQVLAVIKRHFPDHSILAEESGAGGKTESKFLWAIDPLDGTTNFSHSYPFSAVSVGLLIDGIPSVGAIYDPFHDELFCGAIGLGATCDRKPIQVSTENELKHSLLVTGFAYDRTQTPDNNYAEFCHFTHITHGVRRGGAASVDLAYVACGRVDGYWERGLSIWDIAAGVVIVREAGGTVTAYDGGELDLKSGRILATNTHIHSEMITELAKVKPLQQTFPMSS
ncbi:inositol monophosphatase/fructose-1,6-bisphosphatase family protein [Synechococcus sp. PCC 7502]|uniref:inositol monophosphatase family protein n=1 Tax=Synechococcus sp. PCC 7502 TaxID=1173263 RepID=UPI00029FC4B1|nr:inositol monophosphatase family protein [Synechococcus sp. PCC 7502]AFY73378.1 inositol monophosphatase/fructose-1,6-bisphosphatase family protein [Synechococcus sp. PCC 7502]